jgi:hypothetical protein
MCDLRNLIPKPIKRLGRQLINQLSFRLKLQRAIPVLVYQMGKVGSTSVHRSLLEQYPGVVLHSHNFSLNHEDPAIKILYQWAIIKARPLKVISLTREPIDRNISAFFQNFERDTRISYTEASFSIDELKSIFLSNYAHETPLKWFDESILKHFDIDVFSTPFPESGISTYSHNNIDLLVMRLEISDDEKARAISDFLGLKSFQLQRFNIGKDKNYSATYQMFKNGVMFPFDYVDRICNSKYFNHFYCKEVIEAARERWSEKKLS